jgi:hypothetical protein
VIRFGAWRNNAGEIAATVRGIRDRLLGATRVVVVLGTRREGGANGDVLGHLLRRNPELVRGLDPVARPAARAVYDPRTSTLDSLALAMALAGAREIAARLRSGTYVTNTPETLYAKRARSTTPGIETGQLADALDAATARTE